MRNATRMRLSSDARGLYGFPKPSVEDTAAPRPSTNAGGSGETRLADIAGLDFQINLLIPKLRDQL